MANAQTVETLALLQGEVASWKASQQWNAKGEPIIGYGPGHGARPAPWILPSTMDSAMFQ
jgi:hypothetical protein